VIARADGTPGFHALRREREESVTKFT